MIRSFESHQLENTVSINIFHWLANVNLSEMQSAQNREVLLQWSAENFMFLS